MRNDKKRGKTLSEEGLGSLETAYAQGERPFVLLANKLTRRSFLHKVGIGAVILGVASLEPLKCS